jgi:hypothetical protein
MARRTEAPLSGRREVQTQAPFQWSRFGPPRHALRAAACRAALCHRCDHPQREPDDGNLRRLGSRPGSPVAFVRLDESLPQESGFLRIAVRDAVEQRGRLG